MFAPLAHAPAFRKIWPFGVGTFAATILATTAALAGPMQSHSMEMDHPTTFAFGVPGKAAAVDRTIPIKARDVSFDVESVNVKAGETVRFVITNEGAADHEFTLGDAATQAEHRQEMLDMADMDASHAHDGDANAVFLKSGETKELVWAFTKTGLIEFACNVPGHYEAGMKGIIAVQ